MRLPGTYISPAETGFYYLNSRYYDPEICRFINADRYITTGQGLNSFNMFAYCGNNPINCADYDGNHWYFLWLDDLFAGAAGPKNDYSNTSHEAQKKQTNTKPASSTNKTIINSYDDTTHNVPSSNQSRLNNKSNSKSVLEKAVKAVDNFVTDRFSTPEKASNTLSAIGWSLDVAAGYCTGVAAGYALPTMGMSVPTAGSIATALGLVSLLFHGAALIIDIYNEE